MRRYSSKVGDIFCVPNNDGSKRYFQYVISDKEMLDSSVIRIFKKTYNINENPDLNDVVKDEIDFYSHVIIKWGIEMKLWEKIGNLSDTGKIDVLFKDSQDIGNPNIKISDKWSVWKVNEPKKFVGKLEGENQKAEIGLLKSPRDVIRRIRTGKYNFTYPGYDEKSIMTYTPSKEGEIERKLLEEAIARKMAKINARKKK
jgi:hypothetical protein